MLVEFSVENFLSIKEKVTLSMLASKSGKENPDNLIDVGHVPTLKGEKLLKSVAIYGANASGKTNVLRAFEFVKRLVSSSHEFQPQERILDKISEATLCNFKRFKLDESCLNLPIKFNLIFVQNFINVKYEYGFSLNEEKIIEEHLYHYPNGYKTIIFEREESNKFKFTQDIQEQEALSKRTSENKLYLSVASQWNFEKVKNAYNGITDLSNLIDFKGFTEFSAKKLQEDIEFKKIFLNYLKKADFDIEDVEIIEPAALTLLYNALKIPTKEQGESKTEFSPKKEIYTYHFGIDKNNNKIPIKFNLREESKGTQEYFNFLGILLSGLKWGAVFVVDEIEDSLHPSLVKNIIELFHNPEINKNNAQLIFTTHETNLLSLDLLRRDQIWFTERKEDKSTDLYSLAELSPRLDENIQKGYLNGRYGAIPFLGDWSLLCPEE